MIDLQDPAAARVVESPPNAAMPLVAQQGGTLQGQPAALGTPAHLLAVAVQRGATLDELRELMTLEREWRKDLALQAYNAAFAAFKAEAIKIVKTKRVRFETQKGVTDYKHAELSDIVDQVTPALSRHGLSASWRVKAQERDWIVVECTLRHAQGHSESVEMGGPPDQSGGKNAIQSIASAKTYLERYTLKAICGLAEQGDDDDGKGAGEAEPDDPVLAGFVAAALRGDQALKAHYDANVPTEDFWRAKGAYLRRIAKDVTAKQGDQP